MLEAFSRVQDRGACDSPWQGEGGSLLLPTHPSAERGSSPEQTDEEDVPHHAQRPLVVAPPRGADSVRPVPREGVRLVNHGDADAVQSG